MSLLLTSPHCPLDVLSAFALLSWPSSLSCSLPQFFLVTFSLCSSHRVSLHPFLLFSPSSFTFPSYPQSSRLTVGPLRSLWSKYFPGNPKQNWDVSFKTVKVFELRTEVGGRMGHTQEPKAQPHSGHNSFLLPSLQEIWGLWSTCCPCFFLPCSWSHWNWLIIDGSLIDKEFEEHLKWYKVYQSTYQGIIQSPCHYWS